MKMGLEWKYDVKTKLGSSKQSYATDVHMHVRGTLLPKKHNIEYVERQFKPQQQQQTLFHIFPFANAFKRKKWYELENILVV